MANVPVVGTLTVGAALSALLLLNGVHSSPPASVATPTVLSYTKTSEGYSSVTFNWAPSTDATGYKLYLDGKPTSLVGYVGAIMAIKCGKHRFNVQPFNNKGVAKLPLPLNFTIPC